MGSPPLRLTIRPSRRFAYVGFPSVVFVSSHFEKRCSPRQMKQMGEESDRGEGRKDLLYSLKDLGFSRGYGWSRLGRNEWNDRSPLRRIFSFSFSYLSFLSSLSLVTIFLICSKRRV